MTSRLEDFIGKPVVIQLVEPIAAVHSVEEIIDEDMEEDGRPVSYGRAAMSVMKKAVMNPQTRQAETQDSPILQQVLQGEIETVGEEGFIFSTKGGDGKTRVAIYTHFNNVRAVTFALEHVAQEEVPEASPIIRPN